MIMDKEKSKGWFSDLTKKQKVVFGVASFLVVVLIAVFIGFSLSGKLEIGADIAVGEGVVEEMSPDSVLICTETNYEGCTELSEDVANLTTAGYTGSIKSVAVGENVGNMIACQDANYRNVCRPVPAGYRNPNTESLSTDQVDSKLNYNPLELSKATKSIAVQDRGRFVGDTNDILPEAQGAAGCVPGDNQVAVYNNANYDGISGCAVLNADYFDHYAKFAQCPTGVSGNQCINLYPGVAYLYGGTQFPDNSISSIKVGKNAKLTVFEDQGYGGDSAEITESVANLSGSSIFGNDKITSIKVGAKDGYIAITPAVQTLPPATEFSGATAYSATATISGTSMTSYRLGTKDRKPDLFNPYNGGILTPAIALTDYANSGTNITTKITGTTGAAGKYGYITLKLYDSAENVIAQRSANLNISEEAQAQCQLVASPTSLTMDEGATSNVTVSAQNGTVSGGALYSTVFVNGAVSSDVVRVNNTNRPTFAVTSQSGSGGKSATIKFYDERYSQSSGTGCAPVMVPVSVNQTVEELKITPTSAEIKSGYTLNLFTVTGLQSNDNRGASTSDTNIAKVHGFWSDPSDSTKGYVHIAGVSLGTTTLTVASAGRTVTAKITVVQGETPGCTTDEDCEEGQECVNGQCVDDFDIIDFTANPTTINEGDQSTLTWATEGYTDQTSCQIDQSVGGVTPSGGSVQVQPYTTTAYTLTCSDQGRVRTQVATVTVNQNICPDGETAMKAEKNLWQIKTLFSNSNTGSETLEEYLGQYILSYYFDGFGNDYGAGSESNASEFIGRGFWLKNKTGYDYICLATSGTVTTSVEKELSNKGLEMIGNPLAEQISIKDDISFKFSSIGDSWISWDDAISQNLIKAAFIWNNQTTSYLSYINLSKYGDFAQYGYMNWNLMQDDLGPSDGMWIVPKSTDTVSVKFSQE